MSLFPVLNLEPVLVFGVADFHIYLFMGGCVALFLIFGGRKDLMFNKYTVRHFPVAALHDMLTGKNFYHSRASTNELVFCFSFTTPLHPRNLL